MNYSTVAMMLSIAAVLGGLALKSHSRIMCVCMVFGGLMVFFGILCWKILHQMDKICPACGARIYLNAAKLSQIRGGMIHCPKCGAMVRVNHISSSQ